MKYFTRRYFCYYKLLLTGTEPRFIDWPFQSYKYAVLYGV